VILLGDRGFRSVDLFEFIDKELKWKYCIRCTKDTSIVIEGNNKIKKIKHITIKKNRAKCFRNIRLTKKKYI